MIIDFHTHIFPDKIAKETISKLENAADIKAHTDGTFDGLKKSMSEGSVDLSVILPVVTNPKQFMSINKFAAELTEKNYKEGKGMLSFGGIHPDSPDYKAELREICNLGLKGIKLHPDYQDVFFDDIRYMRIVDYASQLGLIISVHAGLDGAFPECIHCTPKMSLKIVKEVQPEKLVLAHMGGMAVWNEVEELLVGENVFFDTSFVVGLMDDEQLVRIIKNHGIKNILFATDSPWGNQQKMVQHLKKLDFTKEEQNKIFSENALELLR